MASLSDAWQDADLPVRISAHRPDALHSSTDQMLPDVSACPLRARSGGKPGEFTVTSGDADMPPELERAGSPGAGLRPSNHGLVTDRHPSGGCSHRTGAGGYLAW